MTIQEAIKESHECAVVHGFHNPSPSIPAMLAMINGELSKALEANGKGKKSQIQKFIEPWIYPSDPDMNFSTRYEFYIKDTFESELADACICIFDLAGKLELEIWNPPMHLKEPDLPGNIMEAMEQIGICYNGWRGYGSGSGALKFYLSATIGTIFAIAKKLDIDLWAHIQAAMRYNRLREYRHGKKY